jgi:hypothetical protein
MAETSRFWDGTSTGDATAAPYDAATEFAGVLKSIIAAAALQPDEGGVLAGQLNECATSGAATPISVAAGRAICYGTWYQADAAVSVAVPSPGASTRIDRIVLRKDWAAQTVRVTRIAGVEGGGAPALTQTAGVTWDTPLYQLSITTLGVITLTDQRRWIGLPRLLFSQVGGTTIVNTAAITSFFTATLPAGTLGNCHGLRVRVCADVVNNVGSGQNVNPRLILGATTVLIITTIAPTGATTEQIAEFFVANNNSPTSQVGFGVAFVGSANVNMPAGGAVAAENTAADLALTLSIQMGSASANLSYTPKWITIEVV